MSKSLLALSPLIKLHASEDRFRIYQLKEMLESFGIPCFVKNEYAIGGAGDLSPFDAWPELWLTDDEWLPRAKKLISDFEQPLGGDWVCRSCQESNDGSFEVCWKCGTDAEPPN